MDTLPNQPRHSGLTPDEFDRIQKSFRQVAKGSDKIDFDDFCKIIKSKNKFFTERVFKIFDQNDTGSLSLLTFLNAIEKLANQNLDEKINFVFRIYDLDGDGLIQPEELRHVIKACVEENGMKFSEDQIDDLTTALFEDADPENSGEITFENLKTQLGKHDGLLENISTSIERWLIPPCPGPAPSLLSRLPYWMRWSYIRNNNVFIIFLTLYISIILVLFGLRIYEFRDYNSFVKIARACGQCLNFTCMMVLVFVLRNLITFLRSRGMSSFFPLDDHIFFHVLTGSLIAVFAVFHTVGHLCNYYVMSSQSESFEVFDENKTTTIYNETVVINTTATINDYENETIRSANLSELSFTDYLFTTKYQTGLIKGWASITGIALLFVLILIVVFALPFVRRSGKFEVFYWTHRLFIAFWVLLILHAPNFWKWFIGPAAIYLVERIIRFTRLRMSHYGTTTVTEAVLLPSKVVQLVIQRPLNFTYNPGDYIFIRIPAIAKFEWHPFTLSSAPEQDDFLWLHIRCVGEWTNRLHNYIENQQRLSMIDADPEQTSPETMKLLPFQHYEKSVKRSKSMPLDGVALTDETRVVLRRTNTGEIGKGRKSTRQSFRYLRHKPRVVTLSPNIMEEEKNEELNDVVTVTAVAAPEARKLIKPLKVFIDGPFGAPSSHIFRAEHAVLVAAGIGVTPFGSILQSIMRRYWKERHTCPKCQHAWTSQVPQSVMNLQKVDFIWLNRDQRSFEWFVNLLSQLEIEQAELGGVMDRFLDMHMYFTSALQRADMKVLGLQLALDLLHQREKRDLITGLKTRAQAGRPSWNKVFKRIAAEKKGKVTVFFCGPPQLGRTLQEKCDEFGFTFRKEIF